MDKPTDYDLNTPLKPSLGISYEPHIGEVRSQPGYMIRSSSWMSYKSDIIFHHSESEVIFTRWTLSDLYFFSLFLSVVYIRLPIY